MQKGIEKLSENKITVVAISYDSTDVLKKFAERNKVSFPLLSDPGGKVIARFGLTNKEVAGKKYGNIELDGIPYPGTFFLDKSGVIRAKLFYDGFQKRHTSDDFVRTVKDLK